MPPEQPYLTLVKGDQRGPLGTPTAEHRPSLELVLARALVVVLAAALAQVLLNR